MTTNNHVLRVLRNDDQPSVFDDCIVPFGTPACLLFDNEGVTDLFDHQCDEITLDHMRAGRPVVRCLYPLFADELDPDELPEAFTTESDDIFVVDSLTTGNDYAEFSRRY